MRQKDYYRMLVKEGFKEQIDAILSRNSGDIDASFLGFLEIYESLSTFVPTDRVIYDLGCGYGFQSYFFRKHKKFIMVGNGNDDIFKMPNSEFYNADIHEWLLGRFIEPNHFAICSYVPISDYTDIKSKFRDMFIYYP